MGRPGPIVQLLNRYTRSNPKDPKGHRLLARVGVWTEQDGVVQTAIRRLSQLPGQMEAATMLAATLIANSVVLTLPEKAG